MHSDLVKSPVQLFSDKGIALSAILVLAAPKQSIRQKESLNLMPAFQSGNSVVVVANVWDARNPELSCGKVNMGELALSNGNF